MLQYQFRPLTHWPHPRTAERRPSPFHATWTKTLDLLERELEALRATNIVIQAAVAEADIRQDGMLRASARVSSPAIILSFDSRLGPLAYPCDRYSTWQANVRAIALALEALRAVDRYGVTPRAEQYRGWAKLPGEVAVPVVVDPRSAAICLREAAGSQEKVTRANFDDLYRRACARTHPDHGGSADAFKRVQAAKDLLDAHFGQARA